jgi:hypothetical protein
MTLGQYPQNDIVRTAALALWLGQTVGSTAEGPPGTTHDTKELVDADLALSRSYAIPLHGDDRAPSLSNEWWNFEKMGLEGTLRRIERHVFAVEDWSQVNLGAILAAVWCGYAQRMLLSINKLQDAPHRDILLYASLPYLTPTQRLQSLSSIGLPQLRYGAARRLEIYRNGKEASGDAEALSTFVPAILSVCGEEIAALSASMHSLFIMGGIRVDQEFGGITG